MGPSDRAFSQAKSILGKLDRTIDQLRQQRTTPATVPAVASPAAEPQRPVVPTPPQQRPGQSPFGRATPIRPV